MIITQGLFFISLYRWIYALEPSYQAPRLLQDRKKFSSRICTEVSYTAESLWQPKRFLRSCTSATAPSGSKWNKPQSLIGIISRTSLMVLICSWREAGVGWRGGKEAHRLSCQGVFPFRRTEV